MYCSTNLYIYIYTITKTNIYTNKQTNKQTKKNEFLPQDALSQLRGVSSSAGGLGRSSEPIETLQSRAREWEKKVCVFFLHINLLQFVRI